MSFGFQQPSDKYPFPKHGQTNFIKARRVVTHDTLLMVRPCVGQAIRRTFFAEANFQGQRFNYTHSIGISKLTATSSSLEHTHSNPILLPREGNMLIMSFQTVF